MFCNLGITCWQLAIVCMEALARYNKQTIILFCGTCEDWKVKTFFWIFTRDLSNPVAIWGLMILQFVLSTGTGVNGFTLDPSLGEFILTHPDIKVLLCSLIYHYYKLSFSLAMLLWLSFESHELLKIESDASYFYCPCSICGSLCRSQRKARFIQWMKEMPKTGMVLLPRTWEFCNVIMFSWTIVQL